LLVVVTDKVFLLKQFSAQWVVLAVAVGMSATRASHQWRQA
jgi:hypothetical protein